MRMITVTRDDLEQQTAFATVYTCRGTTAEGDRIRFAGDWRLMSDLYDAVALTGEIDVQVGHWQIIGRVPDADPPEYDTENGLTLDMVMSDAFAREVAGLLEDAIYAAEGEDEGNHLAGGIRRIQSYEEAMMLTRDAGLVLHFKDGSEAHLTVVAYTPRARSCSGAGAELLPERAPGNPGNDQRCA